VEHLNFYAPPNIIRVIKSWRMGWVGHVAHIGGMRNVYKILVWTPEGKRWLRRPRYRCILSEIGWEGVDWMHLAQDWNQ